MAKQKLSKEEYTRIKGQLEVLKRNLLAQTAYSPEVRARIAAMKFEPTTDEAAYGKYNPSKQTLYINPGILANPQLAIETARHEVLHAVDSNIHNRSLKAGGDSYEFAPNYEYNATPEQQKLLQTFYEREFDYDPKADVPMEPPSPFVKDVEAFAQMGARGEDALLKTPPATQPYYRAIYRPYTPALNYNPVYTQPKPGESADNNPAMRADTTGGRAILEDSLEHVMLDGQLKAAPAKPKLKRTNFARTYTAEFQDPIEKAREEQTRNPQKFQRAVQSGRSTQSTTAPGNNSWQSFVESAKKVSAETGYPLPVLLGQAALETGRTASPGNNYFGIKGSGNAGSNNLATKEAGSEGFYDTRSNFAAYKTPEDSMRAYIDLIKNNYPQAWEKRADPVAMVNAIKAGGYATDPAYVAKVTATPEFKQYQNARAPMPAIVSSRASGGSVPQPAQQAPVRPALQTKQHSKPQKPVAAQPKKMNKSQGAIGNNFANVIGGIKGFFGLQ